MRNDEHLIQVECVEWFRRAYPELLLALFAIPNGGQRHPAVASKMKREGVLRGVSDLFLAVPVSTRHGLFLEAKKPKGRLSEHQRAFFQSVEARGYATAVFRSLSEFQRIIEHYLSLA